MYMVIYKNDYQGHWVALAERLPTLEAAQNARKVSGDLVVDMKTHKVVDDPSWLWTWERECATTYAHRHLGAQINPCKRVASAGKDW